MYWQDVDIDSENTNDLVERVQNLKKIAPYIKWNIKENDHDLGCYTSLEVPESQVSEAEYIIERYENGDDLGDYSWKDQFPITFIKINGERMLNPLILDFYNTAKEFVDLIERFNKCDFENFLNELIVLLPKLYIAGRELEADYTDYPDHSENPIYDQLDFKEFNNFYGIENVFNRKTVIEFNISDIIESMMEDLQWSVNEFDNANSRRIIEISSEWGIRFKGSFGLGRDILRLTNVIHETLCRIKVEKFKGRKSLESRNI